MDKFKTKKHILEAAISRHQDVIDNFRSRIKELQESEEHITEEEIDMQRGSLNEETDKFINKLADQLNAASGKMAVLYNLRGDNTEYKDVEKGAVVETDKAIFFISAGVEKFKMNSHEIVPLSTESPFFQHMEGKKKGDKFKYGKATYTIKKIY